MFHRRYSTSAVGMLAVIRAGHALRRLRAERKERPFAIGAQVRRVEQMLHPDGSRSAYLRAPIYTVTGYDEHNQPEYTVKGGKRWSTPAENLILAGTEDRHGYSESWTHFPAQAAA